MSSKGAPPTHQLLLLSQKHLFALENGLGLPNSSLRLLGISLPLSGSMLCLWGTLECSLSVEQIVFLISNKSHL